jgi:hypothetical protein
MYGETLKLKFLTSKPAAMSNRLARLSATLPKPCCSTVLNLQSLKCPLGAVLLRNALVSSFTVHAQPIAK